MWRFYSPSVDPTMGLTLPANPVDGQEFTLVDSMSAPTYSWKLRYVAAKASNKWVFIGGSAAIASVTAQESTTSTAFVDLTTVGPSFTVPVAGDYDWEFFVQMTSSVTSSNALVAPKLGAATASDNDSATTTSNGDTDGRRGIASGLAASDVIKLQYRVTGGTGNFLRRTLFVTAKALGG